MALDRATLLNDLDAVPNDWYSIYQWKPTSLLGYTEWISEWIEAKLPDIQLLSDGLRQRTFRVAEHRGQADLKSAIVQMTEKRIVRAIFNLGEVPVLGRVIDYEVPLKETDQSKHGDIDLLCIQPGTVLCVEAKKPGGGGSVLKAILQAFVYTRLVATRQKELLKDFDLPPRLTLTPSVLTFANAPSIRQLRERVRYPNLWKLVASLNPILAKEGISPFRFFVVENNSAELETCLMTSPQPNGDVKVAFCDGFALNVSECLIV